MATALKLRADIKKYEAALKSKATPQSLKAKLEKQLEKAKGDLADMRSNKPTEKKAKKGDLPKQFGAYKGSGVDIKKDSERPAKPIGKRKSKSGNTYYEYRLNRIDIKQPPKKYPKLAKGGETSDSKVRFDVYGYKNENNRVQDGDDIIRVNSYKEAENQAQKYLNDNSYELVELYRKDKFVGSIKHGKDFVYSSRYVKEDFADGGMMEKGGETKKIWEEIKSDYVDDEGNRHIDGYLTDNDDEEGKTLAIIDVNGEVQYRDERAIKDPNVQKEINYWMNEGSYKYGGKMSHGGEMHRLDESKMAKGGALEHGLKMGDKIWADQFWDNSVVVDNPKTGRAVVHLETGERKEQGKMEQGGETKSFNPTEFRNLLDKSIESLYTGLNEIELAMRYLEVHGMGKKAMSIAQKIGIPSLKESIENLEEASSNI
jgi:hypothetical protein